MTRNRVLVVVVGVLVVLVWYVGVWRPQARDVTKAHAATAASRSTRLQLEAEVGGLRALQAKIPGLRSAVEASSVAVPSTASPAAALDEIQIAVAASGVAWTNESQSVASAGSTSTAGNGVSTLTMQLQVSGSYQQVEDFVNMIQLQSRLMVIDSLSFSAVGTSVNTAIGVRAFYQPAAAPAASAKS